VSSTNRVPTRRWRHRPDPAKVVALALSLALQFGFVSVISRVPKLASDNEIQAQDDLKFFFIKRASGRRPAVLRTAPVVIRANRGQESRTQRAAKGARPASVRSNLPEAVVAPSLDLSVSAPPVDFYRNPLKRPVAPLESGTPRLEVKFVDRSLGGRLQAMAQHRACGELRAALYKQKESAQSIISAMQRYRCNI